MALWRWFVIGKPLKLCGVACGLGQKACWSSSGRQKTNEMKRISSGEDDVCCKWVEWWIQNGEFCQFGGRFPKLGKATHDILFMRGYLIMHVLRSDIPGLHANRETCYSTQLCFHLPNTGMMNSKTHQCLSVLVGLVWKSYSTLSTSPQISEVQLKALRPVLTTFRLTETARNVYKDSSHAGL